MPFSNGIFSRAYSWVQDAAQGLGIVPARMDADANDIALGLSNCILRDGTGAPTANTPWNGKIVTGLGAPANPGDVLSLGTTPATEVTRALGFQPVRGDVAGGHQIAITYDGTGLTAAVDGNAGFGRVWTANTLTAAALTNIIGKGTLYGTSNLNGGQLNAIAGGTIYTTANFSPGTKVNWDGNVTTLGVTGQPLPYINTTGGQTYYMARCNGQNLISFRWNGSQPVIQVDTSEFGVVGQFEFRSGMADCRISSRSLSRCVNRADPTMSAGYAECQNPDFRRGRSCGCCLIRSCLR